MAEEGQFGSMTPGARCRRHIIAALAAFVLLGDAADARIDPLAQPPATLRQVDLALVAPVTVHVLRGARPGPWLLVTGGVHGDEENGPAVVRDLVARIAPARLDGVLVAVPVVNEPGQEAGTRGFPTATGAVDLNRVMPGDVTAAGPATRHAGALWQALGPERFDGAVDVHALNRGAAYPLFVFVDARSAAAMRMARLLDPDLVKIDRGRAGTLETALLAAGVPAVTFEVGGAGVVDVALVRRAVAGLENLMRGVGMLAGMPRPTAPIIGNATRDVRAVAPGAVHATRDLAAAVAPGDTVARQAGRNYAAAVAGHVLAVTTRDRVAAGDLLVRLLVADPRPGCRFGC